MHFINLIQFFNYLRIKLIKKKKERVLLGKINQTYPLSVHLFFKISNSINKIHNKAQLFKYIEINPSHAIHTGLIHKIYKAKIIIVDLNRNKDFTFISLKKNFPNIKINFSGYKNIIKKFKTIDNALKYNDIIYIENKYIPKIPNNYCNFSMILNSFEKMKKKMIIHYLVNLGRILLPNNFVIWFREEYPKGLEYYSNNFLTMKYDILYKKKNFFHKFNIFLESKISIIKVRKNIGNIFK